MKQPNRGAWAVVRKLPAKNILAVSAKKLTCLMTWKAFDVVDTLGGGGDNPDRGLPYTQLRICGVSVLRGNGWAAMTLRRAIRSR